MASASLAQALAKYYWLSSLGGESKPDPCIEYDEENHGAVERNAQSTQAQNTLTRGHAETIIPEAHPSVVFALCGRTGILHEIFQPMSWQAA